ncbi:MAG: hypothetical protein OEZ16_01675 [Chromatiales bacterium]|nr:hypothetical protein [Chromatiales bacterium]
MRPLIFVTLFLVSALSHAAAPQGMNQADMQKMMEQMSKFQTCIEKIDKKQLKEMEREQKKFEDNARKLCTDGKRDEAEKLALSYSIEMSKKPVLEELSKCGKIVEGMAQGMPVTVATDYKKEERTKHICEVIP